MVWVNFMMPRMACSSMAVSLLAKPAAIAASRSTSSPFWDRGAHGHQPDVCVRIGQQGAEFRALGGLPPYLGGVNALGSIAFLLR